MRDMVPTVCCIVVVARHVIRFVCIVVLHVWELGCTQDAVGNCLYVFLQSGLVVGRSMDEKVQSLWLKLRKHYQLFSPPSQIQGLTAEMIRQSGKGPKLRAKGAETRGVVPFALECAIEMNEHCQTTKSLTILQCLSSLMDFYMLMQLDTWHRHVAAAACRKFCILYSALSQQA